MCCERGEDYGSISGLTCTCVSIIHGDNWIIESSNFRKPHMYLNYVKFNMWKIINEYKNRKQACMHAFCIPKVNVFMDYLDW